MDKARFRYSWQSQQWLPANYAAFQIAKNSFYRALVESMEIKKPEKLVWIEFNQRTNP